MKNIILPLIWIALYVITTVGIFVEIPMIFSLLFAVLNLAISISFIPMIAKIIREARKAKKKNNETETKE